MVVEPSASAFPDTLDTLLAAIERRGLTLFARVDHAGRARQPNHELADEQVLTFGNPQSGTALMQADPRVGIELPLRMLVWRHGEEVLVGYDDPRELAARYDLAAQSATLESMAALLAALAQEAGAGAS